MFDLGGTGCLRPARSAVYVAHRGNLCCQRACQRPTRAGQCFPSGSLLWLAAFRCGRAPRSGRGQVLPPRDLPHGRCGAARRQLLGWNFVLRAGTPGRLPAPTPGSGRGLGRGAPACLLRWRRILCSLGLWLSPSPGELVPAALPVPPRLPSSGKSAASEQLAWPRSSVRSRKSALPAANPGPSRSGWPRPSRR